MATVDDLIEDARGYAEDASSAATELVANAQSAITSIVTGPYIVSTPNLGAGPDTSIDATLPVFGMPTVEVGTEPEGPEGIMSIGDIDFGEAPSENLVAPVYNAPTKPAPLRTFTETVPDVNYDFVFPPPPAALENIYVPPPVMMDYPIPVKPNIVLPIFDAQPPTGDLTPPTDYVERMEEAYATMAPIMRAALAGQIDAWIAKYNPRFHEQMAALESKLAKYIEGGTALTPAIEDQIYERTRGKVNAEYQRVHRTAWADAAKRGLMLPDGVLNAAVQDARQGAANNHAAAAAEIAVKQAELEQQNVQFAITTSNTLRATVMNASISYHNSLVALNGQALDYAKTVLMAMIEVYNSLVKAYEMKLELYKAEATVYSVKMQGALAVIEIYKAEIAALEAMVRVDLAKVELYKGQIEALALLADVYKTQCETIVIQASLEKMKIDLFSAQVQAYGVEAQAKNAEWNGYSAAVGGEEARMHAFAEQVRAYTAEVDAYKATVQAKAVEMDAITSHNRDVTAQYTAQVHAYSAKVDAKAKVASVQVEHNRALLQSFQASMQAATAQANADVEYWRARSTLVMQEFNAMIQAAVETARLSSQSARGAADVANAGAAVLGNLASSAMSGMNTLITKGDQ